MSTGELRRRSASQGRRCSIPGGVDPRLHAPVRGGTVGGWSYQRPPRGRAIDLLYAVLGSGKTAADACIWLLDNGVEPDRIRWIRPRDAWFYDRSHFQPLEQVGAIMHGIASMQAGAQAANVGDLFEEARASGRFVRIDPSWPATMYRGTMLSPRELRRSATDNRRRQARPSAAHRGPGSCSSAGRRNRRRSHAYRLHSARPEQRPRNPDLPAPSDRAQQVRHLSPSFNAALVGFVEAHRDNDADKNRLCPPTATPAASRTGRA